MIDTTARVAEKAGVCVGSLYQYFPNKVAILFRLQSDEWRQTNTLLTGILGDPAKPPLARLRTLVHAFIRSECDEAAVRIALNDAAPLYRAPRGAGGTCGRCQPVQKVHDGGIASRFSQRAQARRRLDHHSHERRGQGFLRNSKN